MNRRSPWFIGTIIVAGIALSFAAYWFMGGSAEGFQRAAELTGIDESIARYEEVKRGGNLAQVCVQAMIVSSAYLSARDLDNYEHWRAIRKDDCAKVPGLHLEDGP